MWPKHLDLTQDECRGALRRLELESYSNVVGAFRAQGTLSAAKLRILKDLREAFHISDARHKAEVRRVVNDESLSTIAKMIYGPNSEIEWNKEGSRGFLIINRKPAQTALSAVSDKVGALGESLNKQLKDPSKTERDSHLKIDDDASASDKIVTGDPTKHQNQPKAKNKTEKPNTNATSNPDTREPAPPMAKKKEPIKSEPIAEQPALKAPVITPADNKQTSSQSVEHAQMPITKQITANSRRRKSTTSLANHCIPAKATMLSCRRDTMIETSSKIRDYHPIDPPPQKPPKPVVNEVRHVPKELPEIREKIAPSIPVYTSNTKHRTISSDADAQIIEAIMPQNVETIKGTQNVMKAISQGAQLVKVIDSKIIKKPVTLSNMYVAKSVSTPAQPIKTTTVKQTYTPVRASNIEYLTVNDCAPFSKPAKAHKIQVIASDAPTMVNNVNVVQRASNHKNDIISIPTARNPNIVKTSDKTIMHVSLPHLPAFQHKTEVKKPIIGNVRHRTKYQQPKHIVQFMLPQQQQHRTVTIHPNTTISKIPSQVQTIHEMPQEYVYEEQVNDWQNYDPHRIIDNQNGYTKIIRTAPNNGHDYRKHTANVIADNIVYDEDITEEYITTEEFQGDNVIEMEVDSANYATDDMILVSNNIVGS